MDTLLAQPQSWPVAVQAIFGTILLSIVYAYLTGERPHAGLPIAQVQQKGYKAVLQYILPGLSWMIAPRDVLAKGKEVSKDSDGIYQIRASGGYKIVLPRRYADEIRMTEHMTFYGSVKKDFHATQPGFEGLAEGGREDRLVLDAVHKLIQNLGVVLPAMVDEADYVVDRQFGNDKQDWRSFDIHEVVPDVIARIFARVAVGAELARNDDWIRVSRDYAVSTFIASVILHQIPAALRPLLLWIIPECRKLRKFVSEGKRLLAPRIQEIDQSLREGKREMSSTPDIFTCLIDVSKGRSPNFALAQLNLSLASIHTTSEVFIRIMIQCCQMPAVVDELREEIVRVLKEEGGWSKMAVYKMKLLDSFMKEVSRTHPMGVTGMLRDVRRDIPLSNGVTLPAGGLVMVEDDGIDDPKINPNPQQFDSHRYLRLREQPKGESRHQFATTSPDNFIFGYGLHQCPGRQFASNEIKLMLSFLLLKYDWRLEPGFKLKGALEFESRIAAPHAILQCRRRTEEVNLAFVKSV